MLKNNDQKRIACPRCGNIELCEGKPGEKLIITCQKCNAKGTFNFPNLENSQKNNY